MDDKWIENVREKMSEFEMTPPEGLWDSIEEGIKTRRPRWWRILIPVAAASAALLAAGYFALMPVDPTIQERPATCYAAIEPKNTVGEEKTDTRTLTDKTESVTELMSEKKSRLPHTSHPIESYVPEGNVYVNESVNPEEEVGTTERDTPEINLKEKEGPEKSGNHDNGLHNYVQTNCDNGKSRFEISISASADGVGGMMNDNDFARNLSRQIHAADSPDSRMGGGLFSDADSNTPPAVSDDPEPSPVELFDHKIPMRYSLNLSFPIYRNLNIDTGIAYSYLKSDIRYGDTSNGIRNGQQKLHFLGVPIAVRFKPLSLDHFDGYISGGVMAEKCIGGTMGSDGTAGEPYSYPGCEDRPWQFSLNAGLGMQYNITRECGIYLEPGFGIYIKNGSALRTIYSERPVTFNLNVGLRFSSARR